MKGAMATVLPSMSSDVVTRPGNARAQRDRDHPSRRHAMRRYRFDARSGGVLLLLSLLIPNPYVEAQSQAKEEQPLSMDEPLKGIVELKNFVHFYETEVDKRNYRGEALFELEWEQVLGRMGRARVVAEARGDNADFVQGLHFQVPETSERRSTLYVKEAVLSFRPGPVDITVGKQIFAWGTADAYNPTDTLNPRDYLDVIDNEKLGVVSAAARLTTGRADLTLVVVPYFTPSRTPLSDSRWVPTHPGDVGAFVYSRELPRIDTFSDVEYAGRLRGTIGGWDLSVSYFDGFERTPVLKFVGVEPTPTGDLPLYTPVFTRIRAPGVDFSTTLGSLEIHGEGAFKFVKQDGRNDVFQGIAGLNYRLDAPAHWSRCRGLPVFCLDEVVFLFEYAKEVVVNTDPESPIVASSRLFDIGVPVIDTETGADNSPDDALIWQVLFRHSDRTQLQLRATANFTPTLNHFVELKISQKVTDFLHVDGGIDWLSGEADTFWGRWGRNDRVFVSTRLFF